MRLNISCVLLIIKRGSLYKDYKIEINGKYTYPNPTRFRITTKYIKGKITSTRKRKGFPFLSKLVAASLSLEVGSLSLLLDTAAVGPDHGRWAFFSSCLG